MDTDGRGSDGGTYAESNPNINILTSDCRENNPDNREKREENETPMISQSRVYSTTVIDLAQHRKRRRGGGGGSFDTPILRKSRSNSLILVSIRTELVMADATNVSLRASERVWNGKFENGLNSVRDQKNTCCHFWSWSRPQKIKSPSNSRRKGRQ